MIRLLKTAADQMNHFIIHMICNLEAKCNRPSVDAGTEMMDGQLMGEFEAEAKELEADSWSLGVEQQYLQQLDRELVKRQDVIYGTSVN